MEAFIPRAGKQLSMAKLMVIIGGIPRYPRGQHILLCLREAWLKLVSIMEFVINMNVSRIVCFLGDCMFSKSLFQCWMKVALSIIPPPHKKG